MLDNYKNLELRIVKKELISEEDVRQAINEDIKNYLNSKYKKQITFRNEVKTSVQTFIDSKYENFVIEYKKPSVSLGDSEREQLKGYLNDLGKYSWGILTNAKELEIYSYSSAEGDFVINESLSGPINEAQFEFICNVIANKEKVVITDNNINEYLGVEPNREIIRQIFDKVINSTNLRTKLFYDEWQKLFNLSEAHDELNEEKQSTVIKFYETLMDCKIDTIEKEYKALFSIQTYYSIVLKMMLYKIILNKTKSKISKPKFLKDFFVTIENNSFYRKYNILNLIDGDFFSWYLNEFDDEQYNALYNLIDEVVTIETNGINLLFIKLYENIFPFWVRHAMGEYYTPLYLAADVVDNTIKFVKDKKTNLNDISLLDPTCGSGIFLIHALNLGIKKVYGIDINPLAVLTPKINYLLNNFDISEPLEIPIYLGDSTYFPSKENINGVSCFSYTLVTSIRDYSFIKFVFAEEAVKEVRFFEILDEIELQIRNKNFGMAVKVLISYDSFHYQELKQYYDSLLSTLVDLEDRNLNSIWLKIIGNYLKTGAIRDVDCITGNPPWVRWSNLPDTYKLLIKNNCRVEGIFSGDKNSGGVDLNICALIAFITIRERLNMGGCLGFIMPDSILFNKSFEGFRKFELPDNTKYYLNKVIRWNNPNEKPFDPVSLPFCEYFFTFHEPKEIDVYDRKDGIQKVAFTSNSSFNNQYIITTKQQAIKIQSVLGRNSLIFRSGVSLVKGGFYQLQFVRKIDDKLSEFTYCERNGKLLKKTNKTILLENEIVYPFVKAPSIDDNEITSTELYCIFPYPMGAKQPYDLKYVRTHYPHFYNFLMSKEVQHAINTSSSYNQRIQNVGDNYGIFRVGEYTWSDWFLITRDKTKSSFAVCGKLQTPWGEIKQPIFDGHVNYVSRDENGNPITKARAYDLFKKFTREGVKLYVKCSSDSRSISGRLYNDIDLS